GALVQQGDIRAGLVKLLEASKLDPENADIRNELALAYRELGEYELSLHQFEKALAIRPIFPQALNNKGTVQLILGKWELAVECFEEVVKDVTYRTPHFAYNNLGIAYGELNLTEKSIRSFRKAISLSPTFPTAYYNLGKLYLKLNKKKEAIKEFEKTIAIDPRGEYAKEAMKLLKDIR
ncbi:MAG: tetratricopeptide repeat protein, partial [Desulfatiglans sp.]|nr:tetratricopeptide repeat protein [Desulfatiglans sp.]